MRALMTRSVPGNELRRPRARAAVACHIIHLAVAPAASQSSSRASSFAEIGIGDTDLLETRARDPIARCSRRAEPDRDSAKVDVTRDVCAALMQDKRYINT